MNDLISTYLNNGGCLSHFEFDKIIGDTIFDKIIS